MTSPVSLAARRYLGRNGCQAEYEKLTMTSKQKTISQISRGWDNILWTLTVDHRVSIARLRVVSPFRRGNNVALSLSPFGVNKTKERLFSSLENKLV